MTRGREKCRNHYLARFTTNPLSAHLRYSCLPVIRRYMQLYPGIELQIFEADTAPNIQKMLNHELDLILSARTYPQDQFERYPISRDRLLLSPSYRDPTCSPGALPARMCCPGDI